MCDYWYIRYQVTEVLLLTSLPWKCAQRSMWIDQDILRVKCQPLKNETRFGPSFTVKELCFNLSKPSSRTMALRSTQPLIEMISRNHPGGKGRGRRVELTTSRHLWDDCLDKMWVPRRLTALWAFMAVYRNSFNFYNTSQSVTAKDSFHSLLDYKRLFYQIGWQIDLISAAD
jgi:hypothetical protein